MNVKTRAVIWIDGRLIVAHQRRLGEAELSLPGGRVRSGESVVEALKREVAEETGLEVVPSRLLYIGEVVRSVRVHDLELIFLSTTTGIPSLSGFEAIDVLAGDRPPVRPRILDDIARDATHGWDTTPRWLGNLAAPRPTRGTRERIG